MADPWIRVHALLRQKSVTFRAMDALGLKRAAAIGHLVMFWSAVSQCGTYGLVADCSDAQLEEWGGWEGTRGRFAKFIREHHLDPDGRVREWDDYAGTLELRRAHDRRRQSDRRARQRLEVAEESGVMSHGHPRDVTRTSAPTIRNDTKRDETREGEGESVGVSEHSSRRGQSVATTPITHHELPSSIMRCLAEWPDDKRRAWIAIVAGWREGMGTPGGKAFDDQDIVQGLTEYLAGVEVRDYQPRHVVRFVTKAQRRRSEVVVAKHLDPATGRELTYLDQVARGLVVHPEP